MNINDKDKANKHILPKKPELNDDMYNWVIAKYGKPNTWTDSQFHRIADDVYTTFFKKSKPEKAQPEKVEAETAKPKTAEPEKPDVIEIGSSSSELECSSTSELECSSTSESELSSYVSSYDESSSSDQDLLN
ncbi:hypothetical protein Tco_0086482 [Tanacetum coccineum]